MDSEDLDKLLVAFVVIIAAGVLSYLAVDAALSLASKYCL